MRPRSIPRSDFIQQKTVLPIKIKDETKDLWNLDKLFDKL